MSSTTAVLHVYRTYFPDPPGGLQEAIRQIALATGKQGLRNSVYTLSPAPQPSVIQRPEATVVRCRSWAAPASCDIGSLDALRTFRRLAAEHSVIHYCFPWPYGDVLHALVRPRTPAVLTYVSDVVRQRWLGRLYAPLMQKTLRSMHTIVANTPSYVDGSPILSQPDIRKKVEIIPLGIDEDSYRHTPDEGVFARAGIDRSRPYFLFVGVWRYYKGLQYLIESARGVDAQIVIAGSGDAAQQAEVRSHIARLPAVAQRRIVLAGQVTEAEKIALLRSCRALVLPSHLRSEAFGMVLVEAAIFGRPAISCEIGTGTSFINLNGQTGIVVPPRRPDALADAMLTLLLDERLADLMGQAARRRYETTFSGPVVGKAYGELFSRAAQN